MAFLKVITYNLIFANLNILQKKRKKLLLIENFGVFSLDVNLYIVFSKYIEF